MYLEKELFRELYFIKIIFLFHKSNISWKLEFTNDSLGIDAMGALTSDHFGKSGLF